jgi:hypothetical protein
VEVDVVSEVMVVVVGIACGGGVARAGGVECGSAVTLASDLVARLLASGRSLWSWRWSSPVVLGAFVSWSCSVHAYVPVSETARSFNARLGQIILRGQARTRACDATVAAKTSKGSHEQCKRSIRKSSRACECLRFLPLVGTSNPEPTNSPNVEF